MKSSATNWIKEKKNLHFACFRGSRRCNSKPNNNQPQEVDQAIQSAGSRHSQGWVQLLQKWGFLDKQPPTPRICCVVIWLGINGKYKNPKTWPSRDLTHTHKLSRAEDKPERNLNSNRNKNQSKSFVLCVLFFFVFCVCVFVCACTKNKKIQVFMWKVSCSP